MRGLAVRSVRVGQHRAFGADGHQHPRTAEPGDRAARRLGSRLPGPPGGERIELARIDDQVVDARDRRPLSRSDRRQRGRGVPHHRRAAFARQRGRRHRDAHVDLVLQQHDVTRPQVGAEGVGIEPKGAVGAGRHGDLVLAAGVDADQRHPRPVIGQRRHVIGHHSGGGQVGGARSAVRVVTDRAVQRARRTGARRRDRLIRPLAAGGLREPGAAHRLTRRRQPLDVGDQVGIDAPDHDDRTGQRHDGEYSTAARR